MTHASHYSAQTDKIVGSGLGQGDNERGRRGNFLCPSCLFEKLKASRRLWDNLTVLLEYIVTCNYNQTIHYWKDSHQIL